MMVRACPRGCKGACELAKRKPDGPGETVFIARPNDAANPTIDRCWLIVPYAVLKSPEWRAAKHEADQKRKEASDASAD